MLILFFQFIFVIFILLGAGVIINKLLFSRDFKLNPEGTPGHVLISRFTDLLVLGIIFVSFIVSVLSIYYPINGYFFIGFSSVFLIIGGLNLILNLKYFLHIFKHFISLPVAMLFGSLMFFGCGFCNFYDSGAYHMQTIKWIKEYGIVPGLANLYGNLGFNSSWHLFLAFFDHGILDEMSFRLGGVLVVFLYLVIALEGYLHIRLNGVNKTQLIKIFGLLIVPYLFKSHIVSQSTDFCVSFMIFLSSVRLLELFDSQATIHYRYTLIVILSVFYAVNVKLSSIPLYLFIPFILIIMRFSKILLAKYIVIFFLMNIPIYTRFYITTGYILYPQSYIDIFNPDWKVPRQDCEDMYKGIRHFAFEPSFRNVKVEENIFARYQIWHQEWFTPNGPEWNKNPDKNVLYFTILVFVYGIVILLRFSKYRKEELICYMLLYVGALFVFIMAPEIRFLSSWILSLAAVAIADVMLIALRSGCLGQKKLFIALFLLFIHGFVYLHKNAGLVSVIKNRTIITKLTSIEKSPMPRYVEKKVNGNTFYQVVAEKYDARAYYGPLPITIKIHPSIKYRGFSIKDGFKIISEDSTSNGRTSHGVQTLSDK